MSSLVTYRLFPKSNFRSNPHVTFEYRIAHTRFRLYFQRVHKPENTETASDACLLLLVDLNMVSQLHTTRQSLLTP
jgi:hypothetical protein